MEKVNLSDETNLEDDKKVLHMILLTEIAKLSDDDVMRPVPSSSSSPALFKLVNC
jgi:hypothetical protein